MRCMAAAPRQCNPLRSGACISSKARPAYSPQQEEEQEGGGGGEADQRRPSRTHHWPPPVICRLRLEVCIGGGALRQGGGPPATRGPAQLGTSCCAAAAAAAVTATVVWLVQELGRRQAHHQGRHQGAEGAPGRHVRPENIGEMAFWARAAPTGRSGAIHRGHQVVEA